MDMLSLNTVVSAWNAPSGGVTVKADTFVHLKYFWMGIWIWVMCMQISDVAAMKSSSDIVG